jgi:S-adenosylmethionine-dependent methyltransferase
MPASTLFDNQIATWKLQMDLPWAKLKYKLTQANLAKHLNGQSLRILDAGGGNGLDSLPLAQQGHSVDIVDYSQAMLADVQGQPVHINTHLADVRNVASLFPAAHFDLILCHNVLQYIEDVPALLKSFAHLLKPNGLLSLISLNRYSVPYHAAFLDGNLAEALNTLDSFTAKAKIFDTTVTAHTAAEISDMLSNLGMATEADYGIRCLCDYWGDNERKSDPQIFAQIEQLEFALTGRDPYKLLARYFQVVARKPEV